MSQSSTNANPHPVRTDFRRNWDAEEGNRWRGFRLPNVSIIIPTYNRARYLDGALRSVFSQTVNDSEVILIDDGSTDETRDIANRYGKKIRIVTQENQGRSSARNSGLQLAQGTLIAFLDSDDEWFPDKLERQLSYLKSHPDTSFLYGHVEVMDEEGGSDPNMTAKIRKQWNRAHERGETYENWALECCCLLSTVILRAECLKEAGTFDPEIRANEELDLYLRIARKHKIDFLSGKPLVRYRMHSGNAGSDNLSKGAIQVAEKHLRFLGTEGEKTKAGRNFQLLLSKSYFLLGDKKKGRAHFWMALSKDRSTLFSFPHLRLFLASFSSVKTKISGLLLHPAAIRIAARVRPRRIALGFYLSKTISRFFSGNRRRTVTVAGGAAKGVRMSLQIGDRSVPQETHYAFGVHELGIQNLFRQLVRRGSTVYDIGSYIGFYSLLSGELTGPTGKVFAFEAVPRNAVRINENIQLNDMEWVACVPKAVGDGNGKASWKDAGRDDWHQVVLQEKSEWNPVETISLDAFVFQENHPPPNFMKIDVEGAEESVLRGAQKVLARFKPTIICELHGETPARAVFNRLSRLGYEMSNSQGEPIHSETQVLALANSGHLIAKPRLLNLSASGEISLHERSS